MKINSLDIAAFGKFKNFHLDLNDDMTVIFGENEAGKSTIMAFIRMMFYGNTGKSSDLEKNPRKKYRPWNSDIMAGSITFEFEGNRYRLEREFKGSNSADKISLIDLDTGALQSLSGRSDIGAKFFGLTDAAFERSVFLESGNAPSPNDAAHGELNARLSNIAVTGDEDTSLEKVGQRLQKAKESLFSKRGKIGKSDKASAELLQIDDLIAAASSKEAEVSALSLKVSELEAALKESSNESSRLFELLKNADKMKKRIFVERYLSAVNEKTEYDKKLTLSDGSMVDRSFIKSAKSLCERATSSDMKLMSLRNELGVITRETAELEKLILNNEAGFDSGELESLEKQKNEAYEKLEAAQLKNEQLNAELDNLRPRKKINLPLIIIGGIVAVAGIIIAVLNLIHFAIPLSVSAVGIILAILGLVFKKIVPADDRELRTQLAENGKDISDLLSLNQRLNEELEKLRASKENHKLNLVATKALLDSKRKELELKTTAYNETEQSSVSYVSECIKYISLYKNISKLEDAFVVIEELEQILLLSENLKARLVPLADHAGCSSKEEAEAKLKVMDEEGISAKLSEQELDLIKEKFKAQSDISGRMRSELASLKAQIKAIADSTPPVAVLQRKKAELMDSIREYEEFANISDIAYEVLEDAFKELRKNYSGALEQKTAEIFGELADGRYDLVNISKDFELSVQSKEAFGLKESAYLSCGTENQLYLALRLALAELITADTEALPIFMDDPLADYDDKRAESAVEFLKDYSKNKQLVMFTCHKGFTDMADKLSVNIQNL